MRVLSIGMGTQSCQLALASAAGDLPKLDHIIFADTQGELPETYEYVDYLRPIVERAGIQFHTVTAGSLEQALLSTVPTSHNPTPPAHVLNPDGTKGKIGQYRCSYDYKRRQIERKLKQLCGGRGAWKRATVEQWIGFSADEHGRVKADDECRCGHKRSKGRGKNVELIHTASGCSRCSCTQFDPWVVKRYPLIERGMRRIDTIRWFADNGHPTPPRSACWFCPNSSDDRWSLLSSEHPDLFERACVLDETIRHGGGFSARGNQAFEGQMFLHGSLTPLRAADLRPESERLKDIGIFPLFDDAEIGMECQAGVCFT